MVGAGALIGGAFGGGHGAGTGAAIAGGLAVLSAAKIISKYRQEHWLIFL